MGLIRGSAGDFGSRWREESGSGGGAVTAQDGHKIRGVEAGRVAGTAHESAMGWAEWRQVEIPTEAERQSGCSAWAVDGVAENQGQLAPPPLKEAALGC